MKFINTTITAAFSLILLSACASRAVSTSNTDEQQLSGDTLTIQTISDSTAFKAVIDRIKSAENALFVFDIDNTLIVTNENGFGSDWWYSQTKKHSDLKLNVNNDCLFGVLTPLFNATFETEELFESQSEILDGLGTGNSKTFALTSRSYSPNMARATELQLGKNGYSFLESDSLKLGEHVYYINGVMYTRGGNKGEILMDYIQDKDYDQIFFFDDSDYKTVTVQESFSGTEYNIEIFHVEVAPKIPYSSEEMEQMKTQLCTLIDLLNEMDETPCECSR